MKEVWEFLVIFLDALAIAGLGTLIAVMWQKRESPIIYAMLAMKFALLFQFVWLFILDSANHLHYQIWFSGPDYPFRPLFVRGPSLVAIWWIVYKLIR